MIQGLFIELMRLQNKVIIKLENLMLNQILLAVNVAYIVSALVYLVLVAV